MPLFSFSIADANLTARQSLPGCLYHSQVVEQGEKARPNGVTVEGNLMKSDKWQHAFMDSSELQ